MNEVISQPPCNIFRPLILSMHLSPVSILSPVLLIYLVIHSQNELVSMSWLFRSTICFGVSLFLSFFLVRILWGIAYSYNSNSMSIYFSYI
ncbi:dubious [Schizosaccharomyces pombe]|uniref:Putative uncharacterized membrane protein PB18E9.05c n=1 Tax=Schizosaccharomyces pombe (strain 972 / ATCC 24843) TaxID=284812 RepID=YL55_SCHPO|nr:uncharacterized protein SPAPB18E9.05c [Schizosaccharomyces pombe]Q8TFG3.1 RecName: Full=Putative uncharacterized membrane protein PB18E9.05c [Schizosaccharomyces pombe 972h-]CAD27471.1 sequence orphan [Schizosaccharomyces pombe]|eukprot:NP_001018273.1 uncharacterized protein SPAPB18E9.05c [Schizosaccharomyces pombe]